MNPANARHLRISPHSVAAGAPTSDHEHTQLVIAHDGSAFTYFRDNRSHALWIERGLALVDLPTTEHAP